LNVGTACVLPVQLELLEIHCFAVLCHFEAPILDEESAFASTRCVKGVFSHTATADRSAFASVWCLKGVFSRTATADRSAFASLG